MEQLTIVVSGPQGSGKDTQVALLKTYLMQHDSRPVVHFDAGTALRNFTTTKGYTQSMVEASMLRGEPQPLFVLAYTMSQFFLNEMHGNEHLLVSGFPRSEDQLNIFTTALNFYTREHPIWLFLAVPEEVSIDRLLKRGRVDDTRESILNRLRWNQEKTMTLIDQFRNHAEYRYLEIDGTASIEKVHEDIVSKLALV